MLSLYLHTHRETCMSTHVYTHTYIYTHSHTLPLSYTHTHTHTHTRAHSHPPIHPITQRTICQHGFLHLFLSIFHILSYFHPPFLFLPLIFFTLFYLEHLSHTFTESHRLMRDNILRLTKSQILIILSKALKTFHR